MAIAAALQSQIRQRKHEREQKKQRGQYMTPRSLEPSGGDGAFLCTGDWHRFIVSALDQRLIARRERILTKLAYDELSGS